MGADKFEISKDIKMKLYDKNGFPIDGYNYYQHIAVYLIKNDNIFLLILTTKFSFYTYENYKLINI